MAFNIEILGRTFNVSLDDDDNYHKQIIRSGKFHDHLFDVIARYVDDGGVCLDIGANVGFMALGTSILCPNSKIYAIEASASNFTMLEQNARLVDNILPLHTAIGEADTTRRFFEDSAYGYLVNEADSAGPMPATTREVRCAKLDTLISELGIQQLHFIKVDVEGGEPQVLKGGQETLRCFRPICLMEFNSWCLQGIHDVSLRKFVRELRMTFSEICCVDRGGAGLTPLRTDADFHSFLHKNMTDGGSVDNLLCSSAQPVRISRVSELARSLRLAVEERDAARVQRDEAVNERDAAFCRLNAIKSSKSWRYMRPLRAAWDVAHRPRRSVV